MKTFSLMSRSHAHTIYLIIGLASAVMIFFAGLGIMRIRQARLRQTPENPPAIPQKPAKIKPRKLPDAFPRNTHLPKVNEAIASGSIDMSTFSPGRDLVHIDDDRVWWESDNDKGDNEDDHTIYRSMEAPLRKLIDLVTDRGATLKVQDTYRPNGIHNSRSLHKEGRAIDLTANGLSLEELAKLCWLAGFDWVYYEARGKGGHHVHCSVKR